MCLWDAAFRGVCCLGEEEGSAKAAANLLARRFAKGRAGADYDTVGVSTYLSEVMLRVSSPPPRSGFIEPCLPSPAERPPSG